MPLISAHPDVAEAVADAAHGQDQLGLARVPLDLLAQVADVDVDRARLAVVGAAAEPLEQLPARKHAARRGCEHPQELELDERELHLAAAHLDGAPGDVDPHLARLDQLVASRSPGRGAAARRRSARTRLRNSRIENGFVM